MANAHLAGFDIARDSHAGRTENDASRGRRVVAVFLRMVECVDAATALSNALTLVKRHVRVVVTSTVETKSSIGDGAVVRESEQKGSPTKIRKVGSVLLIVLQKG